MPTNVNEENILESIKKMLGLDPDDESFDTEIVIYINSVFSTLYQIGASPSKGFYIVTLAETWADFLQGVENVAFVKNYIYLKVRLIFDPPATSFHLAAIENQIKELDFRLSITELDFNPNGSTTPGGASAFVWTVTDSGEFPKEAKIGDVGLDPVTGNLWRNS